MSHSSPEGATPAAALLAVLGARMRGPGAVLLIDGRSGSGKTTLAGWLAPRLGARVLHLEDVYADWTGLVPAAHLLGERLLPAFRAGRPATWRTWDWAAARPGRERTLLPGGRLIVEGCGALAAAPFGDAAVVLEVAAAVRRRRIIARDPVDALPGHDLWAASERRYAAMSRPAVRADVVLRGGVRYPRPPSAVLDTVAG